MKGFVTFKVACTCTHSQTKYLVHLFPAKKKKKKKLEAKQVRQVVQPQGLFPPPSHQPCLFTTPQTRILINHSIFRFCIKYIFLFHVSLIGELERRKGGKKERKNLTGPSCNWLKDTGLNWSTFSQGAAEEGREGKETKIP